jgi:hypothetical protein
MVPSLADDTANGLHKAATPRGSRVFAAGHRRATGRAQVGRRVNLRACF